MVKTLDGLGIIHDLSHLADVACQELLELSSGPIIASVTPTGRSIVPGERQLSAGDDPRRSCPRGGMIGINFYDKFLVLPGSKNKRRANLGDVINHIKHIWRISPASAGQVGLGTDMDGGLGWEQIPVEIETSADLPRMADALNAAGFMDREVSAIMGANWKRFFSRHLGAGKTCRVKSRLSRPVADIAPFPMFWQRSSFTRQVLDSIWTILWKDPPIHGAVRNAAMDVAFKFNSVSIQQWPGGFRACNIFRRTRRGHARASSSQWGQHCLTAGK